MEMEKNNNDINKNPIEDAFIISSLIIKTHNEANEHLDLLKLLKLLYICFGYISADKNQYLFGERIEAWELGPVVPDIYFYVRYYADYLNNYKIGEIKSEKVNSKIKITDDIKGIYEDVEWICKYYFGEKSSRLIALTHANGTPWANCYDGTPSREMLKDTIIKYYLKTFF